MKHLSLFLLFSIASFSAQSDNVWKTQTFIEGVQALPDGSYVLYLPSGSDNACKEGGKLFFVAPNQNGVTKDGAQTILSLSLVAYSSGKKVSVLYDNSTLNCYVQQLHLRND